MCERPPTITIRCGSEAEELYEHPLQNGSCNQSTLRALQVSGPSNLPQAKRHSAPEVRLPGDIISSTKCWLTTPVTMSSIASGRNSLPQLFLRSQFSFLEKRLSAPHITQYTGRPLQHTGAGTVHIC